MRSFSITSIVAWMLLVVDMHQHHVHCFAPAGVPVQVGNGNGNGMQVQHQIPHPSSSPHPYESLTWNANVPSPLTLRQTNRNDQEEDTRADASAEVPDAVPNPIKQAIENAIKNNSNSGGFGVGVGIDDRVDEDVKALTAQKDSEISILQKQKQDRETNINRLKFQLNELKRALEESEGQKKEVQKDFQVLKEAANDNEDKRSSEDDERMAIARQQRKDNEALTKEIQSLSEEISQTRIQAQKRLQEAQKEAQTEQTNLLSQISALSSDLDKTTSEINAAMEEMDAISKDSNVALDAMKKQIAQKDTEIQRLVEEKESLVIKIEDLASELMEVQDALVDSKEFMIELKEQMDLIKEESELSKEELSRVKEDADVEKVQLEEKLALSELELKKVKGQISAAQAEVRNAKRDGDARVKLQKKKSERLDQNVKRIAARDKKILKKTIWSLETESEAAKYNLFAALKEANQLRGAVKSIEIQIKELEEASTEEIEELENRRKADAMFYNASQASSKARMQNIVSMFQRRMARRQEKAKNEIEELRILLTEQFSAEKNELTSEREEAVEAMRLKGVDQLESAQIGFDAKVKDLTQQMDNARNKAEKEVDFLRETYENELKLEREKAEINRDNLIAEKTKIEEDSRIAYNQLMSSMTLKLVKAAEEKERLQQEIGEKTMIIENYEAERSSFRSLVKLTWKTARAKVVKRAKKRRRQ